MTPKSGHEILVVDDSAIVRRALRTILEAEPGFRVVTAADPYEAAAQMARSRPDAVVLDVDMPRMDGLTFLKKLMRQHPLPVILCTDHPARAVSALEHGAREVVTKPDWADADRLDRWASRLRASVRRAITSRAAEEPAVEVEPRHSADVILPRSAHRPAGAPPGKFVAVGASTGGIDAVARLLAAYPAGGPGLVIVQHLPPDFTAAFAARLGADPRIAASVAEARHGDVLAPGRALVIPGTKHGLVRRGVNNYWVELVDGPLVSRHRPSVDVLFRSAAIAGGPSAVGVILTGMGDDGADGLLEIREAGGWTIAQDEATCVVFGMPAEAIRRGGACQVLPLDRIAAAAARGGG